MSLTLSSALAPQTAAASTSSRSGRSDSQIRNDSDSFSAVLKRSRNSAEPEKSAEKSPVKNAALRDPRIQRSNNNDKATEQQDPAGALALAIIALEFRPAATPAGISDATSTAAVATDADLSAAPSTLSTLAQGAQLLQPALVASGLQGGAAVTAAALNVLQPALTKLGLQAGDTPTLLSAAAETAKVDAAVATAATLNVLQPALTKPGLQAGDAPASLSAAATAAALNAPATPGLQGVVAPTLSSAATATGKVDAAVATAPALNALQPALTKPGLQAGDAPTLLNAATATGKVDAAVATAAALNAPQLALAPGRQESVQTTLPAKGAAAAAAAGSAVTLEAGKIADQAMLPVTRSSAQQSKQNNTGTDSKNGKFTEAQVAASIADAAAKVGTIATDQFAPGAATAVNQAGALPQPFATVQQAAATPANLPLTTPVGSSEWGDELGKQMVWMGNSRNQVAELQLNPAGLGPLKITLTINNHQAEALFVSAHPLVRAAVEAALPQLRANLADNGISLGNTSVSADTQQQGAQDQASQSSQPKYRPDNVNMPPRVADLGLPAAAAAIAGNRNNVDIFA